MSMVPDLSPVLRVRVALRGGAAALCGALLALAGCSASVAPPSAGPAPPGMSPPAATTPTSATPPPATEPTPAPGQPPADGAPPPGIVPPAGDAGAAPAAALPGDGLQQLLVTSAIGLGYYTACHIMPGLDVRCFGDRHPRTMPPAGLKTRQMTCAHDGCCALIDKGADGGDRIRCWSDKRTIFPPAAVARAVDPIQIGIGYQHGCALNVDHSVTCWGQPGTMNAPPAGLKAKSLAVAAYFNCAVQMDDSVVCWGVNPPAPPAGLKAKLVTVIFHAGLHLEEAQGGTRHACAIQLDDTVKCWGDDIDGTTDVPPDLGRVRDIAAATYNTCAVRPDGELVCWGTRRLYPERYKERPPGLKLKGIRGKFGAYCGIQLDDTIACWGEEKTTHLDVPAGVKAYVP
jgi:hypothetical protein